MAKNNYQIGIIKSIRKSPIDGDQANISQKNPISSPYDMHFRMVEVVKNINRFESSIKHKPNVFSVVVQNSNLAKDPTVDMTDTKSNEYKLEKFKESLRNSINQFVRNTCEGVVPAHTQLFDVQFT